MIGAGIMGSGIAQLAATAGHEVMLVDVAADHLERAVEAVDGSLARLVRSGRLAEDAAVAARQRIGTATDLAPSLEGAGCVVEAVHETLRLKQDVLNVAAAAALPDALLATNTSQLSIKSIGSGLGAAALRLVGMHFFNPPVIMGLVELVAGTRTEDTTLERARAFAAGLGKEVVVCRTDSPGFITTRAYAALRLECLRMLEEGVATVEDIDKALRLGFNFPMGPFELGDFNGLDTYLHVLTALADVYGDRFLPTVTLRNLVAAGRLGKKTGGGFYDYDPNGTRLSLESK